MFASSTPSRDQRPGTRKTDTRRPGRGNNADGVDSSNPSQGHGGPNGAVDSSCPEGGTCVDDETQGGSSNSNAGGKKK